jgi:hypothetical protein
MSTVDDINLLVGNHYFSSDNKLEDITDYFCLTEKILNTNNFCAIMLGDFILIVLTGRVDHVYPTVSVILN